MAYATVVPVTTAKIYRWRFPRILLGSRGKRCAADRKRQRAQLRRDNRRWNRGRGQEHGDGCDLGSSCTSLDVERGMEVEAEER